MVLVIAYGNPIREDDGVAWEVARRLRREGLPVDVVETLQLVPEMATLLPDAGAAIFIDADHRGPAGRVRCHSLRGAAGPPSLHTLDPRALLHYARHLYGHAPKAFVLTIAGERFGFGTRLSAPVRRALPAAIRRVSRLVRSLNRGAARGPRRRAR